MGNPWCMRRAIPRFKSTPPDPLHPPDPPTNTIHAVKILKIREKTRTGGGGRAGTFVYLQSLTVSKKPVFPVRIPGSYSSEGKTKCTHATPPHPRLSRSFMIRQSPKSSGRLSYSADRHILIAVWCKKNQKSRMVCLPLFIIEDPFQDLRHDRIVDFSDIDYCKGQCQEHDQEEDCQVQDTNLHGRTQYVLDGPGEQKEDD